MHRGNRSPTYLERDWSVLETLDREYWAAAYRRSGPETASRASSSLWQHMRRVRPDWPNQAERDADLQHHVSFKRLLDRAANVAGR